MRIKRLIGAAATCAALAASVFLGSSTASAVGPNEGLYTPVTPVRVMDTRDPASFPATDPFYRLGPYGPTEAIVFQVIGKNGIPSTGVGAVVLNVTVTNATADGFIRVYKAGGPQPQTSNLGVTAGVTSANLVTVDVLPGFGLVTVYTHQVADIIVDLVGWYSDATAPAGGNYYSPVTTARALDTRNGTGPGARTVPLAAGEVLPLAIAGNSGIPSSSSVKAATLSITSANSAAAGYITVFPCDQARPTVSSLNFRAGEIVANSAIAGLSATGTTCFYSNVQTDLIVDVSGYYSTTVAQRYVPIDPIRVLDSRDGTGMPGLAARPSTDLPFQIDVANRGAIPANPAGVLVNTTVTDTTGPGFATAWPCSDARPLASFMNYRRGELSANSTNVGLGPDKKVCLFMQTTTNAIVDVYGYFI